jgi:hypothetical protein
MRSEREYPLRNEIGWRTIFRHETSSFEATAMAAFGSDFSSLQAHIRADLSDEKIFSSFPQRPLSSWPRR